MVGWFGVVESGEWGALLSGTEGISDAGGHWKVAMRMRDS